MNRTISAPPPVATTRHIQLRIPDDMFRAISMLRAKRGQTMQEFLESAVRQILATSEGSEMASMVGIESKADRIDFFIRNAPIGLSEAVMGIVDGYTDLMQSKFPAKSK